MAATMLALVPAIASAAPPVGGTWAQVGADVDGEAAGDQSGRSVAMSADGTTMIIGAPNNDGTGTDAGHARVYTLTGGAWTQVGADIDGEAAGDQSGGAVAMSADGTTVIIGATHNDDAGTDAGHARVYTLTGGAWTQVGADIDGEATNDRSGYSVAMSDDGNTVIIGALFNNGNGGDAGHARVHTLTAGAWTQVGADIDGEAAIDQFGSTVAMSADGNTVIIGAQRNDDSGVDAGHARVYTLTAGAWTQVGADIDGEATGDRSGYSVAMSGDGNTIVVGARDNDGSGAKAGQARIYTLTGGAWTQVGADIDGEAADDRSGFEVAMNEAGDTVIIGAIFNDGNGTRAGQARIYTLNGGTWTQIGADIDGEAADDRAGFGVAMSDDGTTIAVTAQLNDGTGVDAGHARVFEIDTAVVGGFQCSFGAGVLTWTDDAQPKYWIYQSVDAGATYNWIGRTTGATTFTVPSPAAGALYQVHYQGIDRVDCTIVNGPPPAQGPFACEFDSSTGEVTWTDDAQPKYWIYQSVDAGATYSWIGRTTGATTFTVPSPAAGALYQVHYQGIDRVNCTEAV